ncbi:hypothetical protein GGH96_004368 [Coemansia sp. RSA 1972]|nr:hypothetical protein GGH96_004368 [Coemansia sp. RSA 1972]
MEFSQRPAHPSLSRAHGYIAAAPASAHSHYSYAGQDAQQAYYAPVYAQLPPPPQTDIYAGSPQSLPPQADIYAGSPQRLPSLSQLLEPQDTPQQVASVQAPAYTPRFAHADRPVQQHYMYAQPAYPVVDAPKAYGIDVPAPRVPDYGAQAHRDSESGASSVSSQGTLVGSYSPAGLRTVTKQTPPSAPLDRGMCEDDVFAAASILMSLRTCKMPC